MGKKDLKCMICDGNIIHNSESEKYTCSDCKANFDANVFHGSGEKISQKKFNYRFRSLFALIGALYLLWLAYRIFMY